MSAKKNKAPSPKPSKPKNAPDEAAESGKPKAAKVPTTPKRTKGEGAPRTSGLMAALQVLSAAKEPMRIGDITKAAIDKGLWNPAGKTPSATLAAAIGREIKDKGKQSRFKKTDRGLFIAVTPR